MRRQLALGVCLEGECTFCKSESQPSKVKISYDQMDRMNFQKQYPAFTRMSDTIA